MGTGETFSQPMKLGRTLTRPTLVALAVGVVGLAIAALLGRGEHGAEGFFRSYLSNFMFFLSLALGALFFVLISHLTRAGWSVALRRLAEVVAWTVLPLALLGTAILFGAHDLYEWTHADVVAEDELLQHKSAWLNMPFFVGRYFFYFAVWVGTALFFLWRSSAQDESGDPEVTQQLERVAAPAMIFYAMTVTFAAFDLLMSLYPHWYSTIYGVYFFAGGLLGFCALLPVLLGWLGGRSPISRIVNSEHYHDIGKLIFAFVVFWAYIAFSQFMLIWYGNLSEETIWYKVRQSGPWLWISLTLLAGHFVLPFLFLMSRHPKRRGAVLVAAAVWLLTMHWFDIHYLVMPEARPAGPIFQPVDFACFVGIGGLFFATLFWRLGRVNLIPLRDPRLRESLRFENV